MHPLYFSLDCLNEFLDILVIVYKVLDPFIIKIRYALEMLFILGPVLMGLIIRDQLVLFFKKTFNLQYLFQFLVGILLLLKFEYMSDFVFKLFNDMKVGLENEVENVRIFMLNVDELLSDRILDILKFVVDIFGSEFLVSTDGFLEFINFSA